MSAPEAADGRRREPSPDPALPSLPHTWRAVRTRRVAAIASAALIVVVVATVLVLPRKSAFTPADRVGMVGLAVLLSLLMFGLARSSVRATGEGVDVVNVVYRRHLSYAEIVHVRLTPNDPWAVFDLDDGSTMSALGIATSDGERAHEAVAQLIALVTHYSATPRDD